MTMKKTTTTTMCMYA